MRRIVLGYCLQGGVRAAQFLAASCILSCGNKASNAEDTGEQKAAAVPVGWRSLGPFGGIDMGGGIKWTGTTTDVENPPGTGIYRISTLANGLFEWNGAAWTALTSAITPLHNPPTSQEGLMINTFASQPGNSNTIVFGTHSDYHFIDYRDNSGIWRGTKGAQWSWTQVVAPADAKDVNRIRWSDANTVHAATSNGYWISRSAGAAGTWTQAETGEVTDLIIKPDNPNVVYVASSLGLEKLTWVKRPTPPGGWGLANQTIISLQTCKAHLATSAALPSVVYYMAADSNCTFYGLWKVTNDAPSKVPDCTGGSLTGCFPSAPWPQGLGSQPRWDGAISLSPDNADRMMIGAQGMFVTNNATASIGNLTWSGVSGMHVDLHAFGWGQGTFAMAVGDGGYFYANVSNLTNWLSNSNTAPMISAVDFDLQPQSKWLMTSCMDTYGFFTSDFTNNAGVSFQFDGLPEGDGVTMTADVGSSKRFWATDQDSNCWRFDGASQTWASCNLAGVVLGPVTHDRASSVHLYSLGTEACGGLACGPQHIYQSNDFGQTWTRIDDPREPSFTLTAGTFSSALGGAYRYLTGETKLWRSIGLGESGDVTPPGARSSIIGVATHPSSDQISAQTAWAWTNYGNIQIFVTKNAGNTWTEITDNFPPALAVLNDLVPDPASGSPPGILYAATSSGVYKYTASSPAGQRWNRWIKNLPVSGSQEVRRLRFVDARPSGGISVYAAIFGPGIAVRDGFEPAP